MLTLDKDLSPKEAGGNDLGQEGAVAEKRHWNR